MKITELIIIQDSQITKIAPHGITYHEHDGEEQFIDFMMCYANYLSSCLNRTAYLRHIELNPTRDSDIESYVDFYLDTRVIGRRNSTGDRFQTYKGSGKPYIRFYTEPVTVIEFDDTNIYGKIWQETRRTHWHLSDET